MTGILSDTTRIATLLHRYGALSVWDYATAAPHVPIRMAATRPGSGDQKDAVFLSPHTFIGGPQTPGILIVRRDLVTSQVPAVPGGGTVAFAGPHGQHYLDDPSAREEGGTPAIVESIRAGLVFALKEAVGTDLIQAREERFWRRARARWDANPAIELLGSPAARRLPIVSFRIRHHGQFLPHNFVVALLNDLFGIQARGGCSCAGPYGHRLLDVGAAQSRALRDQITDGWEGIKPGWTQVNFRYCHLRPRLRLHHQRRRPHRQLRAPAARRLPRSIRAPACGGTTPAPPNHRSASPMCASGLPGRSVTRTSGCGPARTCSTHTSWTPETC